MGENEKNVPKRRFKEFENAEAWEQRKVGDVIDGLYNGQTPSRFRDDFWNGNINWLSSGELNRSVVIMTSEKITVAGQDDANLHIVPKNTFVMAITGLEAAGTRGNCGILGIDTTLNQSCMAVFPNKKLLSTQFLFQWYKLVGEKYGIRFTQGTKQQSYNAEIIKNLDICLPKVEEQLKIGELLSELDNLITLHQRKLEKMKALKKAYLTDMFPAEGERKPKLRFAGFIDEWEQRKIKEVCSISTGKSNTQDRIDDGIYPFYVRSPIIERSNKYLYDEEAVLTVGDGVGTGKVFHYVNGKYDLHQRVYRMFDFINGTSGKYFYYYFSNHFYDRVMSMTAKTSVDSVRFEMISEMDIMLPNEKEQAVITTFFDNLNNLITLHQRKLEKLQDIKKAYLNEMFI